jgi:hypothetical protein
VLMSALKKSVKVVETEADRNAARYRWLREHISDDGQFFMTGHVLRSPEEFDAAIDAEIAADAACASGGLKQPNDRSADTV